MINVFAVFTVKLLQTLQNSSFHKTCYLDAKTNVLHNFALALYWKTAANTSSLTFLKIGHDKRFCCFYWKTVETLQNSRFHKTCYLDAKTNVLHNFALAL